MKRPSVIRWWPLPLVVLLPVAAWTIQPPYLVADGILSRTMLAVSAVLLLWLIWKPKSWRLRSWATATTCSACALRAATIFADTEVSRYTLLGRASAWTMLGFTVAALAATSGYLVEGGK